MVSAFVRKMKRHGGVGVWGSYVVDEDEHGLWLYTPPESLFRGTEASGESVICNTGWPEPPGAAVIHLIPTEGWWFARWQDAPTGAHVAIDICTPATHADGVWSYDDLELDLIKYRHGSWRLDDEDEFDHECQLGRISSVEREASLTTVEDLRARLDQHDPLFDLLGWERLDRYASTPFAPLVELP